MVLTQPMSDEEFDGRQQVISTEINFSSIVGLWGHEDKLLLELSTAPDMFLVSGTARLHSSVKRRKAIDITGGQIRRVPYHFVSVSVFIFLIFVYAAQTKLYLLFLRDFLHRTSGIYSAKPDAL